MAQVLRYYKAIAAGSSTMYYYEYADNTSQATRIYTGTVIDLYADYASRIKNGMYPMKNPSGWIYAYHVDQIEPWYETVLDECTPPTALSIDAATRILTITGGDGGDLNAFSGFGVSWRERSVNASTWGEWSADTVVTSRTVSVTATSGAVRQYRVRTMGEAGSEHYSDYVLCQDLVVGNTAAGTPVVLLPLAGAASCADVAAFTIECPEEPDGDNMTLQRSLNGGEWTDAAALGPEGGVVTDVLALSGTGCAVQYRLMDAVGAIGGQDGISIQKVTLDWPRTLSAGNVIANKQTSFAQDIRRLHQLVNTLRAFYGQSEICLPGTVGRFGDVQEQLSAMQSAVDGCRSATGRAAYGFAAIAGFPTSAQLNQLAQAIHQT